MKKLFLILILLNSFCQLNAQNNVNIQLSIDELNFAESIYLEIGSYRFALKVTENGNSSIDASIDQLPSFIKIVTIKGRKIEPQLPMIWFDSDSISLKINWSEKSFQMAGMLGIQKHSETIASLKGKKRIDYLLSNPDNMPSLYFMDRHLTFVSKRLNNITLTDIEKFLSKITPKNQKSSYYKRIENFLDAKKRMPVTVGNELEAFSLADKNETAYGVLSSKNKPKLIAILSSTCSYSIASIQLLEQFHRLSNGQIELITIWDGESPANWLSANKTEKEKITWTNLYDEFSFANTYLNLKTSPSFYFVTADNVLAETFRGYSKKTGKKMTQLLKEHTKENPVTGL